jgi:hypothetical protein
MALSDITFFKTVTAVPTVSTNYSVRYAKNYYTAVLLFAYVTTPIIKQALGNETTDICH